MTPLHTAGLVVLQHRQVLLAFSRRKQAFYLPGGKLDPGETAIEALIREVQEELNVHLTPDQLRYYTHITAPAFGEADSIIMEQECFLTILPSPPQPAAEIVELRYFTRAAYSLEPHQVPGVILLFQQLQQEGLID